jgi:hypothetical protein
MRSGKEIPEKQLKDGFDPQGATCSSDVLFVEILFAVRTITFRGTSLFLMHNGHCLTHNWLMSTFGEKVN